eukprot:Rhum_TRINITY_DN1556_c0_g1::Rhum_TRINITY_DN1556_c0_g1_i1::g.4533::m.4533
MVNTEMLSQVEYETLASSEDEPPPNSKEAELIALGRKSRKTAALDGTSPHIVDIARLSVASHVCEEIGKVPQWGNRPVFRQEDRACANLQVSKFVITDLDGQVLRVEQAPEGNSFTLEAAARRLIVTGRFTNPSANEADDRGDGYTRTEITYKNEARSLLWTFPRDSITNVGLTTTRGKSASVRVTARTGRRKAFFAGLFSLILCSAGCTLIFTGDGSWLVVACFLAAVMTGYCGLRSWLAWLTTEVSSVREEKTDEMVIQVSGVYPVTLSHVNIDFSIECDDKHFGNILDFIEAVTPESTPVASRVPLSEISRSEPRAAERVVQ